MISLKHIHQRIGRSFLLEIESLTLHKGLTLLVGGNGAGKTSLLEMISTADPVQEGVILYDGKKAESENLLLVRSKMGYVPSSMELYGNMTVYQQMRYFAELRGMDDSAIIDKLFFDFRLEEMASVKVRKLSSGTMRRIHIAQSLLSRPQFLMLDEPMNGLDSAERRRMISYLSQYARNRIVVASAHELQEWEGSVEHILWLSSGKVAFYGSAQEWVQHVPNEVFEGKVSDAELALISEKNLISRRVAEDGHVVRILAAEQVNSSFCSVTPGFEDAYFIRKRSKGPLN